jgi:hypothetical protein
MMKVIVVFKRLLASENDQHGRHLFKWGNRWDILGFNFTKRDTLSSVYKISMGRAFICRSRVRRFKCARSIKITSIIKKINIVWSREKAGFDMIITM